MSKKDRPLGVAIIAILLIISGVIWIFTGIIFLGGVAGIAEQIVDILGPQAAGLEEILGFIFLILGLFVFLLGLGLWKLNIIAYILVLISLSLNVLGLLINFNYLLTLLLNGYISALINPLVTILMFIYFIKVRDHF
ncbi:MAG: hypothetical protein ACFFFH_09090 [Candidatus Thorarchaeota archaeon]